MTDTPLLYDWASAPVSAANAPVTARPGQALNSTAQGGILSLGADATGTARTPKVDASGSQYVVSTSPAGVPTMVFGGQPPPTLANQYGNLLMARQDAPTPAAFNPLLLDQTGSLQTHLKSKVTFTALALGVTCGTNVNLFALQNGSQMVLRLSKCSIYIPPAGGTGGALLGQGTGQSYFPVFCEMRRATGYTGGTAITPMPSDSGDVLASGVTCARTVTGITGASGTFYQADAYSTNITGLPFYERGADANAKTFVIRPGECVYVVCTSNGTVNSTTAGGGTVTAQANILVTFTQAPA